MTPRLPVSFRAFSSSAASSSSSPLSGYLSTPHGTVKNAAPTEISPDNPQYQSILARRALIQAGLNKEFDNRRRFAPAQVVPPHRLANESLYPTRYIPPKPPLLGPTNAVARRQDPFYLTGIDPLDQALNPNFVAAFTDALGRIKSRKLTGLTRKSQNKVAKMVKRARAMGVVGVFNAKNSRVSGYGAEPLGDRF